MGAVKGDDVNGPQPSKARWELHVFAKPLLGLGSLIPAAYMRHALPGSPIPATTAAIDLSY